MPETTPLIKAALNLRVGVGFDVYAKAQVIPALSITVIVTPFGSFLTMSTGLLVWYRPYLPYF